MTPRPIVQMLVLTALVAGAALSGCGNGKQLKQLQADSVSVEGDLFIWAATVARLQADSTKGGAEAGPEATNQALQQARAHLKQTYDRRDETIKALLKLR